MKKILYITLMILLAVVFAIEAGGCGKSYKATIKVYNWGDYIDKSVIDSFEEENNIKIVYDEFDTNEDMYSKLKAGGNDYDVIIPSDYMIKKLINENMLQKLDFRAIPNYKYIDSKYKNLSYDLHNEYSVPYMWGTVGIIYNKTMVKDKVDSWNILWNPKYKKQIFMLDSERDSIGITLKLLGYTLNSRNRTELEAAKEMLIKQKPLVLSYVGDEVKDKMIGGEAALAVVWSGDAVYMKRENKDLEYVVPKEGSNIWFDAMAIPKAGKHRKEAEEFINYMCRTDIAMKNALSIGYSTPQTEVRKKLPKSVTSDPVAYPDLTKLKNSEIYDDLSTTLGFYDRIWTELKSN